MINAFRSKNRSLLMPPVGRLLDAETFEKTTLDPPIGSGPYVIAKLDPGKTITYKRDPNYWGRDLPVNRGLNNFDEIRYEPNRFRARAKIN